MNGERKTAYQRLMGAVRVIHIYLTLFAFLLLVFFGATGFMLNHSEWFGLDDVRAFAVRGRLPRPPSEPVDKLAVVEELRNKLPSIGALDSFEVEADRLRLVFKKPAHRAEIAVMRSNGEFEAAIEARGPASALTDLHRGVGAGSAWRWLIDGASLLLLAAAASGLTLWTSLPRRRRMGVAALVVGMTLCVVTYLFLVP